MRRPRILLWLALLVVVADSVQLRADHRKHANGKRADPPAADAKVDSEAQNAAADWAEESAQAIQQNIAQAAKSAMAFTEAGAETVKLASEADLKAAEKMATEAESEAGAETTFKVEPPEAEGVKLEPAPGQNDPPVMIRDKADYMAEVETTTDFMGSHSYETDVKELLGEVDESENKIKGLKLRVVEKENFVDSLVKRESLLTEDLQKDKVAVENLNAHVKALGARIQRLKSEKELTQLEAQFHQYSDAAEKMEGQVAELNDVKSALFSKMQGLHAQIGPLRESEEANMRLSINADPADQTAQLLQAAAAMQASAGPAAGAAGASGAAAGASGAAAAPAA